MTTEPKFKIGDYIEFIGWYDTTAFGIPAIQARPQRRAFGKVVKIETNYGYYIYPKYSILLVTDFGNAVKGSIIHQGEHYMKFISRDLDDVMVELL